MIQAHELMLDNYVTTILFDEPKQVKNIKQQSVSDGEIYFIGFGKQGDSLPPEYIQPIPLTEDILIRCGFERHEDAFKYPINNGWYIIWELNTYLYLKFEDLECEISHVQYQYLHQIQNLIFSLTKQKITLK